MKSRFEADSLYSNNYLRIHGYAMSRFGGKRKSMSLREKLDIPFQNSKLLRKARKVKFSGKYQLDGERRYDEF